MDYKIMKIFSQAVLFSENNFGPTHSLFPKLGHREKAENLCLECSLSAKVLTNSKKKDKAFFFSNNPYPKLRSQFSLSKSNNTQNKNIVPFRKSQLISISRSLDKSRYIYLIKNNKHQRLMALHLDEEKPFSQNKNFSKDTSGKPSSKGKLLHCLFVAVKPPKFPHDNKLWQSNGKTECQKSLENRHGTESYENKSYIFNPYKDKKIRPTFRKHNLSSPFSTKRIIKFKHTITQGSNFEKKSASVKISSKNTISIHSILFFISYTQRRDQNNEPPKNNRKNTFNLFNTLTLRSNFAWPMYDIIILIYNKYPSTHPVSGAHFPVVFLGYSTSRQITAQLQVAALRWDSALVNNAIRVKVLAFGERFSFTKSQKCKEKFSNKISLKMYTNEPCSLITPKPTTKEKPQPLLILDRTQNSQGPIISHSSTSVFEWQRPTKTKN